MRKAFLLTAALFLAPAIATAQQAPAPRQMPPADMRALDAGLAAMQSQVATVIAAAQLLVERQDRENQEMARTLQARDARLKWFEDTWRLLKPEAKP